MRIPHVLSLLSCLSAFTTAVPVAKRANATEYIIILELIGIVAINQAAIDELIIDIAAIVAYCGTTNYECLTIEIATLCRSNVPCEQAVWDIIE